jgi:hypothetical protein
MTRIVTNVSAHDVTAATYVATPPTWRPSASTAAAQENPTRNLDQVAEREQKHEQQQAAEPVPRRSMSG